jgi:hypothetical protein
MFYLPAFSVRPTAHTVGSRLSSHSILIAAKKTEMAAVSSNRTIILHYDNCCIGHSAVFYYTLLPAVRQQAGKAETDKTPGT